jgi:hypothetical protein
LHPLYDDELEHYEKLASEAYSSGQWEPDYGTYVLDHRAEELYLIAPEFWHRLALTTSNSKLIADPAGELSWQEIRARLEGVVVGFAGLSVGGNLLEGWLREARPRRVKVADPDWVELTNFNRGERMSLRHLVAPRSARFDPRNPYDLPRMSKLAQVVYEQKLVDPYLEFISYKEPLSPDNIARFLAGDGDGEPPIQVLVEEVDDLDVKIQLREAARRLGIDVLMLTDYGHRVQTLWNPFASARDARIGAGGADSEVLAALDATRVGDRRKVFEFSDKLCQFDYAGDPFERFVNGEGEQPTSSLPQSGATTMIAGGIGGKEVALRMLGHVREETTRGCVFDFLGRRTWRTNETAEGDARCQ